MVNSVFTTRKKTCNGRSFNELSLKCCNVLKMLLKYSYTCQKTSLQLLLNIFTKQRVLASVSYSPVIVSQVYRAACFKVF